MKKSIFGILGAFLLIAVSASGQTEAPFRDSSLNLETRIDDLIGRLTREEKIALFGYDHKGIDRLGIPAYNWWNEALHGVARAGSATVFPQAIGLAATFNDSLIQEIAAAISTEARAKYNLAIALNRRQQYMGLTFWSPNINLFRDPRWGRGQETYGEDPYLTSRTGTAFVRGLQGNHPRYLKASAGAKHFAAHSGPEATRHTFNAVADEKDLRETYLYAFQKLVHANVEAVMCGYNRLNGVPCCTADFLLDRILRREWGFKGHVVTDCWALEDVWLRHKVLNNSVETAAAAIKAGVNLDCSYLLQNDLQEALDSGMIDEGDIDRALRPTLATWFRLGFFDEQTPFDDLGAEHIRSVKHIELARIAASQSMVLLKNDNNLLPLDKQKYKSILVTGTNAASADALLANYHGVSPELVTFVEGITKAAGPATAVQYDMGCDYQDTARFGGIWVSQNSDVTVAVVGMTPVYEGEGGDAFLAANGGDKKDLSLPPGHVAFMKALRKSHDKPIVAVVTGGGALDIGSIEAYADAIIMAWYSGEQGGRALADILFGKVSPSGRLPVTFYQSVNDLPPYEDYGMQGRTYRYFTGKARYPFGYGLSYTTFSYTWKQRPRQSYSAIDTVAFEVAIRNTGQMDGAEVVQVYIQYPEGERMPVKELKAFQNVSTVVNSGKEILFEIPVRELQKWDLKKGKWYVAKGAYKVIIGGNSEDEKLQAEFRVN